MVKNQLEVYSGANCTISTSDKSNGFYPTLGRQKKSNDHSKLRFFSEYYFLLTLSKKTLAPYVG